MSAATHERHARLSARATAGTAVGSEEIILLFE
jgi:hypothetical protein